MNPFNVMLVDDEILVIQHLKRLISWLILVYKLLPNRLAP
jgi:YesN/AraC family two-component response regulator